MATQKTSSFNFFKGCNTLDEVKQLYRTLAKQLHPDAPGGDTAKFQALANDFEIASKMLANNQRAAGNMTDEEFEQSIADTAAYKAAIDGVINIDGIVIELVGSWVWLTGNTYPVRDNIKASGFIFAGKKKAWYFRTDDHKVKNTNKKMSLEDIKAKYGSIKIGGGYSQNRLSA